MNCTEISAKIKNKFANIAKNTRNHFNQVFNGDGTAEAYGERSVVALSTAIVLSLASYAFLMLYGSHLPPGELGGLLGTSLLLTPLLTIAPDGARQLIRLDKATKSRTPEMSGTTAS